MITLDLSILNQKGTPMFFSDVTANRPAAGIVGRIFIATDSPYGIFRDTGSAWDQVAGSGGGGANTIYTGNDTLTSNRIVSSGGFTLTFAPQTTFLSSLTAATNASIYSVLGQNTLSYAAGFSSSNLGLTFGAIGGINLQTFAGSATFAQSNLAAANISVNSVDFSAAGSTITMTQATGLRVMAGHQSQFQYQGTNSGTITHVAISQNLGFYRPPAATGTLTITNAYGHLINDLNDYGAGFTFSNRWGIYQAGASDKNYFAGNVLIGNTVNSGENLQVNGNVKITGSGASYNLYVAQSTIGQPAIQISRSIAGNLGQLQFLDGAAGNFRSWGIGIGRSGDPSNDNDFIFGNYPGFGGWRQAGRIFNVSNNWVIGTDQTDVASAILRIDSTTKGFRPPVMTNAQILAIASPVEGLQVYNTTISHMCCYQAGAWVKFSHSPM